MGKNIASRYFRWRNKNGYSPNPADAETGYWVLGLGALGDNGFNVEGIKPVIPTEKVLASKLKNNDFLVSRSNTPDKVGRSVRFKGEVINCSYPDLMMKFRIDSELACIDYIEHVLKGPFVRRYYKDCAAGSSSSMVKINKLTVEKTPLILPPILEQQKIAKILSTWDKAISVTEQLISNSQQQKKALMQGLLTGTRRLAGFSCKWINGCLTDIALIAKGKALSSKDLEIGSYPVIAGGKTSPYFHSKFTNENVITVSASGAYAGYVAFHSYKIWASDCSIVDAKDKNDVKFIHQLLTFNQENIYSLQSGGAQPHIYPRDLASLKISIPPLEEQQKIAEVLTAADREIELLQQKLAGLKQEKQALMQQLLTGKRRVAL